MLNHIFPLFQLFTFYIYIICYIHDVDLLCLGVTETYFMCWVRHVKKKFVTSVDPLVSHKQVDMRYDVRNINLYANAPI